MGSTQGLLDICASRCTQQSPREGDRKRGGVSGRKRWSVSDRKRRVVRDRKRGGEAQRGREAYVP